MRSRLPILCFASLFLCSSPVAVSAQDDATRLSATIARNLRKNKDAAGAAPANHAPASNVIDNDNLAQVMEDARKARPVNKDKTVFSIDLVRQHGQSVVSRMPPAASRSTPAPVRS